MLRLTPLRGKVLRNAHKIFLSKKPHFFRGIQQNASQLEDETRSVKEMDTLLKVIQSQTDPALRGAFKLGQSMPWSQTLLSQKPDTNQAQSNTGPSPLSIKKQKETVKLPARSMRDSYSQIILPFASDPQLFEQYTSPSGSIRLGKLLEHLDSLAGSIAYRHMLGSSAKTLGEIEERGFYIVTAAVDRLDLLQPDFFTQRTNRVNDLILSGHVVFTGVSSMEIAVKMETAEDGMTLMLGRFSMVCRDAASLQARAVNPLILETDEERALYEIGKEHKEKRNLARQHSLTKTPPSSLEAAALHDVYLSSLSPQTRLPSDVSGQTASTSCTIEETKLENTLIMFPQERNVHQKIFGGYLMRLAYELGYADALLFTRSPVHFISLDGISFRKPVPIGSLLSLTSHVTCTQPEGDGNLLVHVVVQADVVDPWTGLRETTNDFKFTWSSRSQRAVAPRTYKEAMMWLEGRRALALGANIRVLRGKD